MIKTTLWMGMSLNGMIARENNQEDFISHDCWLTWIATIHEYGCMIWGRKTYEIVKQWPQQYLDDIKGVKAITVSTNQNLQLDPEFERASNPQEALEKLSKAGFERTIITGGSKINSSFAKLNLIDEVILLIEPVIVGKGIPVFAPEVFDLKLEFADMTHPTKDIVLLKYNVIK